MLKKNNSSKCEPCGTKLCSKSCSFVSFVIQIIFASLYAFSIYFICSNDQIPVLKPNGKFLGQFKYLTIWDVCIQLFISLLNVLLFFTTCSKLTRLRDNLHHGLSLVYGLLVFILFWSIYAIDRKLIFPKEIEPFIPCWLNHLIHTLVGITPFFNEFTIYQERTSSAFNFFFALFISYLGLLLYFAIQLDFWIYPIFEVLNNSGRIAFLVISFLIGFIIFKFGGFIHKQRWSKKIKAEHKKVK